MRRYTIDLLEPIKECSDEDDSRNKHNTLSQPQPPYASNIYSKRTSFNPTSALITSSDNTSNNNAPRSIPSSVPRSFSNNMKTHNRNVDNTNLLQLAKQKAEKKARKKLQKYLKEQQKQQRKHLKSSSLNNPNNNATANNIKVHENPVASSGGAGNWLTTIQQSLEQQSSSSSTASKLAKYTKTINNIKTTVDNIKNGKTSTETTSTPTNERRMASNWFEETMEDIPVDGEDDDEDGIYYDEDEYPDEMGEQQNVGLPSADFMNSAMGPQAEELEQEHAQVQFRNNQTAPAIPVLNSSALSNSSSENFIDEDDNDDSSVENEEDDSYDILSIPSTIESTQLSPSSRYSYNDDNEAGNIEKTSENTRLENFNALNDQLKGLTNSLLSGQDVLEDENIPETSHSITNVNKSLSAKEKRPAISNSDDENYESPLKRTKAETDSDSDMESDATDSDSDQGEPNNLNKTIKPSTPVENHFHRSQPSTSSNSSYKTQSSFNFTPNTNFSFDPNNSTPQTNTSYQTANSSSDWSRKFSVASTDSFYSNTSSKDDIYDTFRKGKRPISFEVPPAKHTSKLIRIEVDSDDDDASMFDSSPEVGPTDTNIPMLPSMDERKSIFDLNATTNDYTHEDIVDNRLHFDSEGSASSSSKSEHTTNNGDNIKSTSLIKLNQQSVEEIHFTSPRSETSTDSSSEEYTDEPSIEDNINSMANNEPTSKDESNVLNSNSGLTDKTKVFKEETHVIEDGDSKPSDISTTMVETGLTDSEDGANTHIDLPKLAKRNSQEEITVNNNSNSQSLISPNIEDSLTTSSSTSDSSKYLSAQSTFSDSYDKNGKENNMRMEKRPSTSDITNSSDEYLSSNMQQLQSTTSVDTLTASEEEGTKNGKNVTVSGTINDDPLNSDSNSETTTTASSNHQNLSTSTSESQALQPVDINYALPISSDSDSEGSHPETIETPMINDISNSDSPVTETLSQEELIKLKIKTALDNHFKNNDKILSSSTSSLSSPIVVEPSKLVEEETLKNFSKLHDRSSYGSLETGLKSQHSLNLPPSENSDNSETSSIIHDNHRPYELNYFDNHEFEEHQPGLDGLPKSFLNNNKYTDEAQSPLLENQSDGLSSIRNQDYHLDNFSGPESIVSENMNSVAMVSIVSPFENDSDEDINNEHNLFEEANEMLQEPDSILDVDSTDGKITDIGSICSFGQSSFRNDSISTMTDQGLSDGIDNSINNDVEMSVEDEYESVKDNSPESLVETKPLKGTENIQNSNESNALALAPSLEISNEKVTEITRQPDPDITQEFKAFDKIKPIKTDAILNSPKFQLDKQSSKTTLGREEQQKGGGFSKLKHVNKATSLQFLPSMNKPLFKPNINPRRSDSNLTFDPKHSKNNYTMVTFLDSEDIKEIISRKKKRSIPEPKPRTNFNRRLTRSLTDFDKKRKKIGSNLDKVDENDDEICKEIKRRSSVADLRGFTRSEIMRESNGLKPLDGSIVKKIDELDARSASPNTLLDPDSVINLASSPGLSDIQIKELSEIGSGSTIDLSRSKLGDSFEIDNSTNKNIDDVILSDLKLKNTSILSSRKFENEEKEPPAITTDNGKVIRVETGVNTDENSTGVQLSNDYGVQVGNPEIITEPGSPHSPTDKYYDNNIPTPLSADNINTPYSRKSVTFASPPTPTPTPTFNSAISAKSQETPETPRISSFAPNSPITRLNKSLIRRPPKAIFIPAQTSIIPKDEISKRQKQSPKTSKQLPVGTSIVKAVHSPTTENRGKYVLKLVPYEEYAQDLKQHTEEPGVLKIKMRESLEQLITEELESTSELLIGESDSPRKEINYEQELPNAKDVNIEELAGKKYNVPLTPNSSHLTPAPALVIVKEDKSKMNSKKSPFVTVDHDMQTNDNEPYFKKGNANSPSTTTTTESLIFRRHRSSTSKSKSRSQDSSTTMEDIPSIVRIGLGSSSLRNRYNSISSDSDDHRLPQVSQLLRTSSSRDGSWKQRPGHGKRPSSSNFNSRTIIRLNFNPLKENIDQPSSDESDFNIFDFEKQLKEKNKAHGLHTINETPQAETSIRRLHTTVAKYPEEDLDEQYLQDIESRYVTHVPSIERHNKQYRSGKMKESLKPAFKFSETLKENEHMATNNQHITPYQMPNEQFSFVSPNYDEEVSPKSSNWSHPEYSAKGYEIFPSKSSNSTGSLKNDPFDLNSCSGYKQPLFETAVTVEDMLSGESQKVPIPVSAWQSDASPLPTDGMRKAGNSNQRTPGTGRGPNDLADEIRRAASLVASSKKFRNLALEKVKTEVAKSQDKSGYQSDNTNASTNTTTSKINLRRGDPHTPSYEQRIDGIFRRDAPPRPGLNGPYPGVNGSLMPAPHEEYIFSKPVPIPTAVASDTEILDKRNPHERRNSNPAEMDRYGNFYTPQMHPSRGQRYHPRRLDTSPAVSSPLISPQSHPPLPFDVRQRLEQNININASAPVLTNDNPSLGKLPLKNPISERPIGQRFKSPYRPPIDAPQHPYKFPSQPSQLGIVDGPLSESLNPDPVKIQTKSNRDLIPPSRPSPQPPRQSPISNIIQSTPDVKSSPLQLHDDASPSSIQLEAAKTPEQATTLETSKSPESAGPLATSTPAPDTAIVSPSESITTSPPSAKIANPQNIPIARPSSIVKSKKEGSKTPNGNNNSTSPPSSGPGTKRISFHLPDTPQRQVSQRLRKRSSQISMASMASATSGESIYIGLDDNLENNIGGTGDIFSGIQIDRHHKKKVSFDKGVPAPLPKQIMRMQSTRSNASQASISSADSFYIGVDDNLDSSAGVFSGIEIRGRKHKKIPSGTTNQSIKEGSEEEIDDDASIWSFKQLTYNSIMEPSGGNPNNLREEQIPSKKPQIIKHKKYSTNQLVKYINDHNILQNTIIPSSPNTIIANGNNRGGLDRDGISTADILDEESKLGANLEIFDQDYYGSSDESISESSLIPFRQYDSNLKKKFKQERHQQEGPARREDYIKSLSVNDRQTVAVRYRIEGCLLMKKRKYRDAILKFSKGLRYFNNPSLYSNRSICYASLNDFDKSLEDIIKAIELDPTKSNFYKRAFGLQIKNRNFGAAYDAIATAFFMDSHNKEIITRLKSIRLKLVQDYFSELSKKKSRLLLQNSSVEITNVKPMTKYQISFLIDFWPFIKLPQLLVEERSNVGKFGYYLKLGIDMLDRCEPKYLPDAIRHFTSAVNLDSEYSYIAYDYRGVSKIFSGQKEDGLLDIEKAIALNYADEHSRLSSFIKSVLCDSIELEFKQLGDSACKEWNIVNKETKKYKGYLFPKILPDPVTMNNELSALNSYDREIATQYIEDNNKREVIFKKALKERWNQKAKQLEDLAATFGRTETGVRIEAYLAIFYYQNEQFAKATDILERLVQEEPQESLYLTLYVQVSRWHTAKRIDVIERVLRSQMTRPDPMYYVLYGEVLYTNKRDLEGLNAFERALSMVGYINERAKKIYVMSDIFWGILTGIGRQVAVNPSEKLSRLINTFLSIDEDNPVVYSYLGYYQALDGHFEAATQNFGRALSLITEPSNGMGWDIFHDREICKIANRVISNGQLRSHINRSVIEDLINEGLLKPVPNYKMNKL